MTTIKEDIQAIKDCLDKIIYLETKLVLQMHTYTQGTDLKEFKNLIAKGQDNEDQHTAGYPI